jgi:4-hydroxy-2-oxoheptanedioate aldolase
MGGVNKIKRAWASDRPAFGLWCAIPDSFAIELIAALELDYVCLDQQHGLIDDASMVEMIRAAGAVGCSPIVRVASNEPWLLMRALDAGALGVVIPMVDDRAQAARAVAACRFPPAGRRSYGPIRAAAVVGSGDPAELASDVLCIAQIETGEGLGNVEEIAATPGLDGLYIGPADLALALGVPLAGSADDPRHVEAVERILRACKASGIGAGMHSRSGELARRYAEEGFSMLNLGTDYELLTGAVRRELDTARREHSGHARPERPR